MITIILMLTIFNTGLIVVIGGGLLYTIRKDTASMLNTLGKHIDGSIESGVTALYNMGSLKQKAEMNGRAEL